VHLVNDLTRRVARLTTAFSSVLWFALVYVVLSTLETSLHMTDGS